VSVKINFKEKTRRSAGAGLAGWLLTVAKTTELAWWDLRQTKFRLSIPLMLFELLYIA
jgi:hypothetical protein